MIETGGGHELASRGGDVLVSAASLFCCQHSDCDTFPIRKSWLGLRLDPHHRVGVRPAAYGRKGWNRSASALSGHFVVSLRNGSSGRDVIVEKDGLDAKHSKFLLSQHSSGRQQIRAPVNATTLTTDSIGTGLGNVLRGDNH
jgi:hypothetical protein